MHRHGIAPKSATAQRDTVLNALNDNIRSSSHVYGQWVLDQDQDGLISIHDFQAWSKRNTVLGMVETFVDEKVEAGFALAAS